VLISVVKKRQFSVVIIVVKKRHFWVVLVCLKRSSVRWFLR